MKEFKKIVVSLLIVCGLLVFVDLTFGFCGDKLVAKIPDFSGDFAKDNYRLNRCDEDIVIVGSSRAAHHYVTSLLRDSINAFTHQNYTVYNAGIDGKFVNSNSCAIESIINRYHPKMIILEVGSSEFYGENDLASEMELSAVHYRKNPIVKNYLDNIDFKEQIKMQSSLYRWNGKVFRMFSSFMKEGDSLGYLPIYGEMKLIENHQLESKLHNREICEYSEGNLIRLFRTVKEQHVNLIVVSSPRYKAQDSNDYLCGICKEYDIPYFEIYNESYFNNRSELFKDAAHLNDEGARFFTNIVFQKLKLYLNII